MDSIRVNLHSHSNLSDGYLSPEELANLLADNGVQIASLTDHDTVKGLRSFRNTLRERGTGFISGIEITAFSEWGQLHLLGYNFDIEDPVINKYFSGSTGDIPHYTRAVEMIHNSGGKVFLAHPLTVSEKFETLENIIKQLKKGGIDGIEAFYSSYDRKTVKKLKDIAEINSLNVSAGTDYHGKTIKHLSEPSITVNIREWRSFRKSLGSFREEEFSGTVDEEKKSRRRDRVSGALPFIKTILPPLLGIVLFTYSIFNLFIPEVENILLSRKKEMIKELTHSAVSILDEFNSEYEKGTMTLDNAREKASAVINHIRYGKENKDYFWITDMKPSMIAHPYRKDLKGSDLSTYMDKNGEFVFIKIVDTVRKSSEGFVEYQWQWKDEETRIVPKISYVKLYEKWGWIVGTGIYVDDVMSEISRLERYLIDISLFIVMLLSIILLLILFQNIKKEKTIRESRLRLQKSDEKYRALANGSIEGTVIIQKGKCTYSNPSARKILMLTEDELLMLTASEIFRTPIREGEKETIGEMLEKGEIIPSTIETELSQRNGEKLPVLIETGIIRISGEEGYIVNIREMRGRIIINRSELRRNRIISELQSSLFFLSEPAISISGKVPVINYRTSIKNAAKQMNRSSSDSFLVESETGEILGIVSDRDIRGRAVAEEKRTDDPVYTIMSSPVIKADSKILIFEAVSIMKSHGIRHLVLSGTDNRDEYVVSSEDLIEFYKYPASVTAEEIDKSSSLPEIRKSYSNVTYIIKTLIDSGSRPRNISRILSSFTDIFIKKIIDIAVKDMGTPPVKFAFISLGSRGRAEQTLSSDQDNAIIFETPEEKEKTDQVRDYFLKLGKIVSDELNTAGLPYCSGNIMAMTEKWCQDISTWKKYFRKWITKPEPEELLHFNMFFDFRLIYGDSDITESLKTSIDGLLRSNPGFFLHLADNVSLYKAPVNLFGNIIFDSKDSRNKYIDIKELILPVAGFARLYSLKHDIRETNTYDRIDSLLGKGVLHPSTHKEVINIYDFLNQIRFRTQASAVSEERLPDNLVQENSLTGMETAMLKNAITGITDLQKRINFDFRGSV